MRAFFVSLFIVFATMAKADIPKPSSLEQTLGLMLPRVVETFPEAKINWGNLNIELEPDGSIINPDNIHAVLNTIDDGAAREAELDRFIATLVASLQEDPFDDGLPLDRVYPVVRHESFATVAGGEDLLSEPFLGDMILTYAIDYPDRVAYVTRTALAEAGFGDGVFDATVALNMETKAQAAQFEGNGTVFFATLDGFYESSLVLDTDLWADIAGQVGDDLVIAVPARDLLVFAPASNAEGVEFLRFIIDDIQVNGTHQLSEQLYIWRDGKLASYTGQ